MKLDVHQVAEATKLKTDQIRALEQGNYEYFSAAIYLRGSARTYASLLKLDPNKLVAQIDEELGATEKFAAQSITPEQKKTGVDSLMLLLSKLNWGIAAVVVALAVIALVANAGYRAVKNHKASDPLKKLGSGMYQSPENSGETLPLPTNLSPRNPPPAGK